LYKGFTLTARTFQVRGSGNWTLDVTIGRRGSLRAFSGTATFQNERDATDACWRMACRIIDASPPDSLVSDLIQESEPFTSSVAIATQAELRIREAPEGNGTEAEAGGEASTAG
jgi:hypothetical protein